MKLLFFEKYQRKSSSKKWEDLLFVVLVVILLVPASRSYVLRGVLATGVLQPTITLDQAYPLSEDELSWRFSRNGEETTLLNLRGKVVLLNFWASWCPPCVAEFPSLEKLYNLYSDNDSIVFLFATNEASPVVNAFLQKQNIDVPITNFEEEPRGKLAVASLPTTYIITKDGKVASSKSGAAHWYSKKIRRQINILLQE